MISDLVPRMTIQRKTRVTDPPAFNVQSPAWFTSEPVCNTIQLYCLYDAEKFGLAVRRKAGKREDLGSILRLRLSFLFEKVVVCGHCQSRLVTLSITSY